MNIFELFILAIGLSMDAFAVSVCKGLSLGRINAKHMCIAGAWFGGFQALMPLVGYFGGRFFADKVTRYSHWVAFVLLVFIGAGMIKESKEEEHVNADMDIKSMFILAVATSIDALAVGVTFAFLKVEIVSAVSFIGVITFVCSAAGVKIGSLFGMKYKSKARNFGQHPALLCGFAHVKGEFVVTMDDDLQHQPEELPKMVRTMQERPDVDVIIASYEGRKHGPIRKLGTKFSVWATSKMLGKDPDLQITSYRLIRRFLVDAMVKTNTYLPQIGNLLIRSSNRIINVPVQHADRAYGKSGYSFKRLLKDLIYDITTHTAFPLLLVRNIGIVSFLISVVLSVCYLVRYFTLGISVQGWTSLMLVMLAFFGLILLSIGIMGIYLMNILNEAKKMPHYVIRREDTDE